MAWSGSGAFSRVFGAAGWTADKNNGIKILSSRHDTNDQDLADGINACLTRNNESKPTSDFLPATDNILSLGSASFRWLLNAQAPALLAQQNIFSQASATATGQRIVNPTAGATAFSFLSIGNDIANDRAVIAVTSSTYVGPLVTNGPTGQQIALYTNGANPLIFGTNAIERMRLLADGTVTVAGVPINTVVAFKATGTTRASTTTPTDDPALSLSLPAGTYELTGCLFFFAASDGTQGYKAQIHLTGTVTDGLTASTWTTGGTTVTTGGSFSGGNIPLITTAASVKTATPVDCLNFRGTITITNTNTVSVQWSQNTSNVVGTQLLQMSNLIARRIA